MVEDPRSYAAILRPLLLSRAQHPTNDGFGHVMPDETNVTRTAFELAGALKSTRPFHDTSFLSLLDLSSQPILIGGQALLRLDEKRMIPLATHRFAFPT